MFVCVFQAKPIYGGWLLLAPEGTNFDNPLHRSRVSHTAFTARTVSAELVTLLLQCLLRNPLEGSNRGVYGDSSMS